MGDWNTKYFHAIASARRRVNRITAIAVRSKVWEQKEDNEKEIILFFQQLYKGGKRLRPTMDGIPLKMLSSSQRRTLEEQFSKEEIRAAVFDLGGDRAPGPDGFPIIYFQHFWDMLEDDLFVFNEFCENGVLVRELGASFLALIPKKHGALSVKDFRPISIIGSIYKILAKVLANRLRKVLLDIISDIQSAFVDGRQILECVIVAHESVDSRNWQCRPGLILN